MTDWLLMISAFCTGAVLAKIIERAFPDTMDELRNKVSEWFGIEKK